MRQFRTISSVAAVVCFAHSVFAGGADGAASQGGKSGGSGGSQKSAGAQSGSGGGAASGRAGNSQSGVSDAVKGAPVEYPLVYRPLGYLGTIGPAPMRFGPPSPAGTERTPPRVSDSSPKPDLSKTAEAMAGTEAIEAYRSVFGKRLPVPEGSAPAGADDPNYQPESSRGSISAGPGPNEVLQFFAAPVIVDPLQQDRRRRFLFDPVPTAPQGRFFQQPPVIVNPAQSRATLITE